MTDVHDGEDMIGPQWAAPEAVENFDGPGPLFDGDQGQPFTITFSAGVAAFPEAGLTVETLLKAADRHLYTAKRLGKNRVVGDDGIPALPPSVSGEAAK